MMSQQEKRLTTIALALAVISILLSGYAVLVLQSISASISDLQSSVSQLKSTVDQLSSRVGKLEGAAQAPAPAAPVRLVVIGPWSGKEAEYFQAVIDAYKKTHPNVEIEYRTMRAEDVAAVMPVQFAAGIAPGDVIFGWAWWIVKMGKEGHVVDVSGIINENDYVSGIVDQVKDGSKIYGVPFTMWLKPGFWYRKSFFQKYGLSEPKSYDEFVSLLEKIRGIPGIKNPIATGDGVGWPESDIVEHFLIAYGGPQLQLDLISGKVRFTDPKVRDVFANKLVPLIFKGYFSEPIEWTTAVTKWWAGEYGLYFMGTWITGMVDDPNDLDFFPLPESKGVVGGADYAFVPKYTKNLDAALDFLKFLATEGQVVHASVPSGKIPTWKKAPVESLWPPMQSVYKKIAGKGMSILPDLDDSIGGDWQKLFWDQLKLLWVNPGALDSVLKTLEASQPKP